MNDILAFANTTAIYSADEVSEAIRQVTDTPLFEALQPLIAIIGVGVFVVGLWKALRSKAGGGGGMGGGGGRGGGMLGAFLMMVLGALIMVPSLIGVIGDGMVGIIELFVNTIFENVLNL